MSRLIGPARLALAAALASALVGAASIPAKAEGPPRPVAVTGRAAPDAGGREFTRLFAPSINDAGQVAFAGAVAAAAEGGAAVPGVWSGLPAALRLNALEGQPSPVSGKNYEGLGTLPVVNADGDVQISGTFGPEYNGLFLARAGDPAPAVTIAATSHPAPQAREKQFFNLIETVPLRLGAGGHSAFVSRIHGKEIETDVNDVGLWVGRPEALDLVARAGQNAPGTPEGVRFSRSGFTSGMVFDTPAVDRDGDVAFVGHLSGTDVTQYNDSGVWFGSKDKLRLVARAGDYVPDTFVSYQRFDTVPTVAAGRIAFKAEMYGPPPRHDETGGVSIQSDSEVFQAIIAGPPDAPKIVASTLYRPAGVGYYVATLGTPVMNSKGQLMYTAGLHRDGAESGSEAQSLWMVQSGAGRLLFEEGDAAPGTGPGVAFHAFGEPSVNDAGQYALIADLRGGGVPEGQDFGLFIGDLDGHADGDPSLLRLLARAGQTLDLGDGVLRTIDGLFFAGAGNAGENGGASGLNHLGQVAFLAHFTDGTSAILVGSVPEPGAVWAVAVVGALLCVRPRHARRGRASA